MPPYVREVKGRANVGAEDTHSAEHLHDGNDAFDGPLRSATDAHDTVCRVGTARGKHLHFDAKLLTHVTQLGAGLADDATGLALVNQHPKLRLIPTIASALRHSLLQSTTVQMTTDERTRTKTPCQTTTIMLPLDTILKGTV